MTGGIYIASKVIHAPRWRQLRDERGFPIISTWIDEAGAGQSHSLERLWYKRIDEASLARSFVLYREKDEILKGAWVELGAHLAHNGIVFAVGIREFAISHHARIQNCYNLEEAMMRANEISRNFPRRPQ